MLVRFFGEYWLILLPCALGAAAVYLLLPQVRRSWSALGVAFGAAALLTVGIYLVKTETRWVETFLFYSFAALAILGGGLLISQTNPVHAALSFALVVLSTCGLFLLQAAPFLMAATIIVYAGAIIVTFLFVIMLAQQAGLSNADQRSREPFLATLAGFIVMASILCILQKTYDTSGIDPLLERTRAALAAKKLDEVKAALGDRKEFFERFRQLADDPTVDNVEQAYVEATMENPPSEDAFKSLQEKLHNLYALGKQVRGAQGTLELKVKDVHASPFSSPNVRRDSETAERLPANNVTALGRTLFTQHLLAVELAGVLLTVASIGAIAIAARRSEGLR